MPAKRPPQPDLTRPAPTLRIAQPPMMATPHQVAAPTSPRGDDRQRREEYEERAAIIEHDGGIPCNLAEVAAALLTIKRPDHKPANLWETFIQGIVADITHFDGYRHPHAGQGV